MKSEPSFVLASASPRRKELLGQLGLTFLVDPADVDESVLPGEPPDEYVKRVSTAKAKVVHARHDGKVVLACDTSVVVDTEILGKPESDVDAKRMLRLLSGRSHRVVSCVAVLSPGGLRTERVSTSVEFRRLNHWEIDWYVATHEGKDKAGGYASQARAAAFIEKMQGSHTNVIGLPLPEALNLLERGGVEMPWRPK
ncbi:MAG: Maf family protein [Myxococcaceae bacterium]